MSEQEQDVRTTYKRADPNGQHHPPISPYGALHPEILQSELSLRNRISQGATDDLSNGEAVTSHLLKVLYHSPSEYVTPDFLRGSIRCLLEGVRGYSASVQTDALSQAERNINPGFGPENMAKLLLPKLIKNVQINGKPTAFSVAVKNSCQDNLFNYNTLCAIHQAALRYRTAEGDLTDLKEADAPAFFLALKKYMDPGRVHGFEIMLTKGTDYFESINRSSSRSATSATQIAPSAHPVATMLGPPQPDAGTPIASQPAIKRKMSDDHRDMSCAPKTFRSDSGASSSTNVSPFGASGPMQHAVWSHRSSVSKNARIPMYSADQRLSGTEGLPLRTQTQTQTQAFHAPMHPPLTFQGDPLDGSMAPVQQGRAPGTADRLQDPASNVPADSRMTSAFVRYTRTDERIPPAWRKTTPNPPIADPAQQAGRVSTTAPPPWDGSAASTAGTAATAIPLHLTTPGTQPTQPSTDDDSHLPELPPWSNASWWEPAPPKSGEFDWGPLFDNDKHSLAQPLPPLFNDPLYAPVDMTGMVTSGHDPALPNMGASFADLTTFYADQPVHGQVLPQLEPLQPLQPLQTPQTVQINQGNP